MARTIAAAILVALGLLPCAGCGAGEGVEAAATAPPATAEPAVAPGPTAPDGELRVCADPNNLPFSNDREEGFENELARLVGAELGREVSYVWWPQRRGFIRNTLRAGRCDVVMGIPSSFELALATRPYYRSSYVFVWRRERALDLGSFDDPRLAELRIGVHLIGDDYSNSPPVAALGRRGHRDNLVGYSVYGDYSEDSPPADLIRAVAAGEVDAAVAWGPLAGYWARRSPVPLELAPVSPRIDPPFLPFVFDVAMGVRRSDVALRRELDAAIERRGDDIRALLVSYGVPLVEPAPRTAPAGGTR